LERMIEMPSAFNDRECKTDREETGPRLILAEVYAVLPPKKADPEPRRAWVDDGTVWTSDIVEVVAYDIDEVGRLCGADGVAAGFVCPNCEAKVVIDEDKMLGNEFYQCPECSEVVIDCCSLDYADRESGELPVAVVTRVARSSRDGGAGEAGTGLNEADAKRMWEEYVRTHELPPGIPTNPEETYAGQGWSGWVDWISGGPNDVAGDDGEGGQNRPIVRVVQKIDGPEVIQGDACVSIRNHWGLLIGVRCPECGTAVIIGKDRMQDPTFERVRDELERDEGRETAEQWASSAPQILECRGCHSLIATYGWMR